jgi:hypothetical protein
VAVWELLDGSRNSLNYYRYDMNGKVIEKYREFSDGITSTERYKYDVNGNMIAEDFQRSDSVSGTATYAYDDSGRVKNAHCNGLKGWFFGEIDYIYDEIGIKKEGIITQKGEQTGNITYFYDTNMNLVKEHWDFSGRWTQTFIYDYEGCDMNAPRAYTSANAFIVNTDNYRLVKEYYDYSNEKGGPSYFEYDNRGKLIEKRFERSDGLMTKTTYLYDCDGKLTKSYRKYSNGLNAIFTYEFTKDRKLLKRTFIRSDGKKGSDAYQYDEDSRLVKSYYNNFDSWLTGTITFSYDKNSCLKTGYFKGDSGFDAEITFEYGDKMHLVKIHWDFSFSKTQTYTFEYENGIYPALFNRPVVK